MRPLLLDNNLSHKLATSLRDIWPTAAHVRWLGYASASDTGVWRLAADQGYTIVTRDGDFQQLSRLHGHPPKVVWLSVPDRSTAEYEALMRQHRTDIEEFDGDANASMLVITETSVLKLVSNSTG